tara:strand:- start:56 stop:757 length:702 start_codon:yes stop_codon:yes gene_type:complete
MNKYKEEDIIKNLNPKEGIDLSKFIDTHKIKPNQYFIFKTGGPHFFSKCKNKDVVDPKYLDLSWPFIYNVKGKKFKIISGTIPKIRATAGYIYCRLQHADEKREMQDFRNAAKENFRENIKEYEFAIHRLVALAFMPNDDPNKKIVDHIDGNRCNYKIENLRWATLKENSRGSAGQLMDPDAVYEIVNQTIWFHGKMGEYEGNKELYNKNKEQAIKQLSFLETFEKELQNETQ